MSFLNCRLKILIWFNYRKISVRRNQKFGSIKTRLQAVPRVNVPLPMMMRTQQLRQSNGLMEKNLMAML